MTLTACNHKLNSNNQLLQSRLKPAECRVIKHELGESCVPLKPQRIIVTDDVSLEILLALNIKPIATPEPGYVASKANFIGDKMQGIELLGKEDNTLNIEKIAKLDPDLIIGLYNIHPENYSLLSKIAPTVNLEFSHREWKQTLQAFSKILAKEKQAEQILINYQQRIEKLQTALGNRIKKVETSIVRIHGLQLIEFRSQYSFPGSVLQEVGFSPPLAQRNLVKTPDDTLFIISPERLDLLDADYLFVAIDPAAIDLFNKYQKSSLWQTLKVAQNQKVYPVDSSYWIFGNILSANAIIDDLYKYLLGDKSHN